MKLTPLHPLYVAQVEGVDLSNVLTDGQIDDVVAACDRFAVLVFRGQALDDATQIAFSARLGPLETSIKKLRPGHTLRLDAHLADISNLDPQGRVLAASDRNRMYGLGDRLWHTDSSFKAVPARYSLLSARVVPTAGGETQFSDLRAAYDDLPASLKEELADRVAEHSIIYSRSTIGFTDFSEAEREALKPVPQRLVRRHPGSGRMSLYLASHAMSIRGMPVPEGRLMLAQLMEHATRPPLLYTHRWQAGDLVMWDDRCTLHRARPYDMRQVRDLRRTTVSDGISSLDQ